MNQCTINLECITKLHVSKTEFNIWLNICNRLQALLDNLRSTPSGGSSSTTTTGSALINSDFVFMDQTAALKAASGMMHTGIIQARDIDGDPPGLHEKAEYLLREWVNMYHSPAAGRDSTKAFTAFVQQVNFLANV